MPWEKNYNESDILERAMHAFWAHGYNATSMNDLVNATGINRGSIYTAFTSKHGLFMKSLEHYDKIHRRDFLDKIARDKPPKEAILAAFDAAARQDVSGKRPGGCLLVNTVLELSPHDDDVRAFVDSSLGEVEDFFTRMIQQAQRSGSIRKGLKARQSAQTLLGLFLGLRVLARSGGHSGVRKAIRIQAGMILE